MTGYWWKISLIVMTAEGPG